MKKQIKPGSLTMSPLGPTGRKLSLNKKTISNLNAAEMNGQVGGNPTKAHKYTCQTCGLDYTCYTCRRTGCGCGTI